MVLSTVTRVLSRMVRILYVVGFALSFFAFFGGPVKGIADNEYLVLGVAASLSIALVVHELLIQERVVALVYKYFRHSIDEITKKAVGTELKVYGASLLVLAAFDAYCGIEFRSGAVGLLQPKDMRQYVIQSISIVSLYLLSSLLAPQDADATGVLNRSSLEMLLSTTKATVGQWTKRIKSARKNNLNLANATAVLMEDAGEVDSARRVRLMDFELSKLEGGVNTSAGKPTDKYKLDKKNNLYLPATVNSSGSKSGVVNNANEQTNEHQNNRSDGHKLMRFRKPRVPVKKTERQRVFDQLDKNPDLKDEHLMTLAKVSRNTARKYRREWLNEHPEVQLEEVQNG